MKVSPKKKTWLIILASFILISIGLWWLGGIVEKNLQAENLRLTEEILRRQYSLETIVSQSLNNNQPSSPVEINSAGFDLDDLNISANTGHLALIDYAKKLVEILRPLGEPHLHEAKIVLQALSLNDQQLVNQLTKRRQDLELLIEDLLGQSIPPEAQLVHLRLINSLDQLIPFLIQMEQVLTQPVAALTAAEKYTAKYPHVLQSVDNINVFFNNRGIIFSEDESLPIFIGF